MNSEALSLAVRAQTNALHELAYDKQDEIPVDLYRMARDCAELGRTLARVIDGATVGKAFGSPGDWGYHHPIGKALAAAPAAGLTRSDTGHWDALRTIELSLRESGLDRLAALVREAHEALTTNGVKGLKP